MADSDDEYDRKRRDKFRGERSSGGGVGGGDSYRTERRDDRGRRDDWPERNPFRGGRGRPDYRDYRGGGGRDRYSPGRDLPPPKRMRPDWGEDIRSRYPLHDSYGLYGWGGHDPYPLHGAHGFAGGPPMPVPHAAREAPINPDVQTQPAMLTLKQFLDTQDDGISDSEVLTKYQEYKLEFKRQQLNEFFVAHKDEEWFKNKYHPEECIKRKEEQQGFLQRRVEVFSELLENGMVSGVTVDTNQSDAIMRLLDVAVIKLEGGTDEDLKVLDEKPLDFKINEGRVKASNDDDVIITGFKQKADDNEEIWDEDEPKKVAEKPKVVEKSKQDPDDDDDVGNYESGEEGERKPVKIAENTDADSKVESKKRKRSQSESSSSSSDSDSSEKSVKVNEEKQEEKFDENDENEKNTSVEKDEIEKTKENDEENAKKDEKMESDSKDEVGGDVEEKDDDNKNVESAKTKVVEDAETIDLVEKEKFTTTPRALHRTSSIFLRNLAPTITKAEIEAVCKRYDGYLRVAIADPLVERRWFRRGWVTFQRDVNIKEICWNLNNIRLRDCEMGAIVNRDLSRRVRPVNGITAHKTIVRTDIKLCAKIALNLDEKFQLWLDNKANNESNGNDAANGHESFGFKTNNPVLQNITDFLIEEASAEEDELLGLTTGENKESTEGEQIERDPDLISVLDKIILYLRIVHSVDFYNHCEYPYEDEMPNRCGIVHARGPAPQNKVTQSDIQDYIKNFEDKLQALLAKPVPITEDELKNLGCKDPEAEVEKFIQANTQELAKDKWLCPLSGKKFKGPEFIRKHIFNKHGEKVDEVRKEVEYFNNYLKDTKRPQLPEHPGNAKRTPSESSTAPAGYNRPPYPAAYGPPYATYAPPMLMPRAGRGFGGGRRELPQDHQRRIVGYHDLDAPANFDVFE